MNIRVVVHILSRILVLEALMMLVPAFVSLYYGETDSMTVFLLTAGVTAIIGVPFSILKPKDTGFHAREGIAIAALGWIILSVFGALPFQFIGVTSSFMDALFESISGFTTTGATVFSDIEALPRGLLFWRCFTQWIGGMGVLVLTIAILPSDKNSSSLYMMKAECAGPQVAKIVPKGKSSAMILYIIYGALTALTVIFLLIGKMPLFDSVCNAMAVAGTGGFSVTNTGIAGYGSAYIEGVITVFMILFGVNFSMYYFIIMRRFSGIWKNTELKVYFGILVASTALMTANLYGVCHSFSKSFADAVFQSASMLSSTGFSLESFTEWQEFSQMIIMMLMIVGGCAGSTAGGFKISRVIILFKSMRKSLRKALHPKAVNVVKSGDKAVDIETVHGVQNYLIIFITLLAASMLLISLDNKSFETTVTAVISCANNMGPGLGEIGSASNYSAMSVFSKVILSVDMLMGRLECLPLIMLFTPSMWRKKFY